MSKAKRVLITGASSGFGLVTAKLLVEKGHTVFATMRDPGGKNRAHADELRAHAEGTEGALHVLALDVTDDAEVEAAVKMAVELAGGIDVVVNNAGQGVGGIQEGFTADQMRALFETNVFGVQRVNRAVLPIMRAQGEGLLVHVTSGVGRVVIPFAGPYVASKFALEALAEVYRYELAGLGIDSVVVEPGSFGTGFIRGMMQPSDEAAVAAYGALGEAPKKIWPSLEKRLATEGAPDPRDVAEAILALIEMAPGTRPLRTSVDALTGDGVRAINAVCDEVQKGVLAGFRMADAARGPKPRD